MKIFINPVFCFVISLVLGGLMISDESLWIDETQTAIYARMATFAEWRQKLVAAKTSEVQMPLSVFIAWVAGKSIGTNEWQLRVPNVLWVGLAGLAVGLAAARIQDPRLFPLFLIHPFLWYYANEARPYALQIAAGCWLLYGIIRLVQARIVSWMEWSVIGLAAILGYGGHFLFGFPLAAAFIWILLVYKSDRKKFIWNSRTMAVALAAGGILAALSAYYLWTIFRGASGAKIWTLSLFNLIFALYEALGFAGLGPPRHELRELMRVQGKAGIFTQLKYLLICLPLVIASVAILFCAFRNRADSLLKRSSLVILTASLALYGAATVVHFPFWGRHLSALLPFFVLAISRSLVVKSPPFARTSALVFIALLIFWAVSSLNLRFNPRYGKDDYRTASKMAENIVASNKTVWWTADEFTPEYYGLTTNDHRIVAGKFILVRNTSAEVLQELPQPDYVFMSKPDVYDANGSVRKKLEQLDFHKVNEYTAFTVWGRLD